MHESGRFENVVSEFDRVSAERASNPGYVTRQWPFCPSVEDCGRREQDNLIDSCGRRSTSGNPNSLVRWHTGQKHAVSGRRSQKAPSAIVGRREGCGQGSPAPGGRFDQGGRRYAFPPYAMAGPLSQCHSPYAVCVSKIRSPVSPVESHMELVKTDFWSRLQLSNALESYPHMLLHHAGVGKEVGRHVKCHSGRHPSRQQFRWQSAST